MPRHPISTHARAAHTPARPGPAPSAPRGPALAVALTVLTALAALAAQGAGGPAFARQSSPGPHSLTVTRTDNLELPFERIDWPAFSPSGSTIVFSASAPDGRHHLYAVASGGGDAIQLTTGAGNDWSARYSPDGQSIAFVSDRSGNRDIWVIPAGGGPLRQITKDPADDVDPDWAPDGKRLVFASRSGGPLLLYQVLLTDLSVFPLSAGSGADRRPAWSPDGRWIAFQSNRDSRTRLYLIPAEGGDATRITRSDTHEENWPVWMPDSRTVVAQAGPAGAPSRLWQFSTDTPRSAPVNIPPAPGRNAGPGAPPPSLSRDGTRLVLAGGGEATIEIVKVTGGPPSTIVSGTGRLRHPSWSKDGRRLVLAGDLSGAWDLWIAGVSSGRLTRLTDDDERELDPVWSRVTGDVLFTLEKSSENIIQLLEPETRRTLQVGSGITAVPPRPGATAGAQDSAPRLRDSDPAWSPDARSFAFVSERGGSKDIYIAEIGGGVPRRLTTQPGSESHPDWSPDGQWITYASDQGSGSEIWKIPAAGGEPMRLSQLKEGVTGDTQPAWSPKGTWIAFTRGLADSRGASDIYIITPEGKSLFPIRRGSGARIMEPAWAPDGEHIAYSFSRPDRILVFELGLPSQPHRGLPGHPGAEAPGGSNPRKKAPSKAPPKQAPEEPPSEEGTEPGTTPAEEPPSESLR
ncbi:MAG TPA: hypothetical protein VJV23_03530 [Candidatus Polarisedimenticolia bacterium]|nr:hypothetical protein [Candidatus Polarisedimenticolia bacterium]